MVDKNREEFKKNAAEAKAVRILLEKKKQYEYLKYKKGATRSNDVVRIGLNIANTY